MYEFCFPIPAIPTITELTATSNPVIGSSFFIQCTVSGTPRPTISWKLNEIPLTASDDEVLRIVSTNNGQTSRVEVSASRRGFDGVYQCIASNDAGNDTMNLRIELQGKCAWATERRVFLIIISHKHWTILTYIIHSLFLFLLVYLTHTTHVFRSLSFSLVWTFKFPTPPENNQRKC